MILRVDARRIVPAGRYTLQRADGRPPLRRISGDASAQALVKQRDRPHTIRDPLLGALRLERAYGWLSARRRIDGRPYDLSIEVRDADDAASMAADVAKAKPRLLRTERQLPAIRRAVARKLLPTYNDGWRTQRPRSSAPAFLKRIALSSIQLARANHHPLRRRRPVRRPRDRGPDRRARRHLRDPAGGVVSG
jgi:hypothetical protein